MKNGKITGEWMELLVLPIYMKSFTRSSLTRDSGNILAPMNNRTLWQTRGCYQWNKKFERFFKRNIIYNDWTEYHKNYLCPSIFIKFMNAPSIPKWQTIHRFIYLSLTKMIVIKKKKTFSCMIYRYPISSPPLSRDKYEMPWSITDNWPFHCYIAQGKGIICVKKDPFFMKQERSFFPGVFTRIGDNNTSSKEKEKKSKN